MLLRLIDKPNPQNKSHVIEIILQTDNDTIAFTAKYFPSPITGKFRETLDWYFKEYLQTLNQKSDDKGVPAEISTVGRSMGNHLVGKNQELDTVKKAVEDIGYEHLTVQIESSRITFFQEPWEILILPDAKQPLAFESKNFFRRFTGENQLGYAAELYYELVVEPPANIEQEALAGMTSLPEPQARKHAPLTVIHLLPQFSDFSRRSNAFNASVQALRWGEAVNYELWPNNDWTTLQQRVAEKDCPVHIFHYEGPVILKNGTPYLCFDKNGPDVEIIAVCELAELLAEHKCALLSVDACVYREQKNEVPTDLGFASIAQSAGVAGIKNVMGLSNLVDPWTKALCFQSVYNGITSGLNLGEAISETRKFLHTQVENQRFTVKPVPFHPESLLLYYGGQAVHFFDGPQQPVDISTSPFYQSIRKRIFGFRSELLPPQINNCEDGVLLDLLPRFGSPSVLSLTGEAGSGKSHLIHQASFYLVQYKKVKYAFYFNCANDFYGKDDILRMIAPVLDCLPDQEKAVEERLAAIRCCFVFDDLRQEGLKQLQDATDKKVAELNRFLGNLVSQGHIVMITGGPGTADDCFPDLAISELPIPPLSALSQSLLGADTLRRYKVEDKKQDTHYTQLLAKLGGHPFLIKKVMPELAVASAKELVTVLSDRFSGASDKVESFYTWQWSKLPSVWKRLLLLLIDSPGVLLEMIMLVCDKCEGPNQRDKDAPKTKNKTSSDRGKRAFEPASKLFDRLGDSEAQFKDGIDHWDRAGFILTHAHGKIINLRCLSFLKEKQATEKSNNDDTLSLLISQIVCEGIRILSSHLQKQPNPIISNNLLMNRRVWAIHLEKLWFAGEYLGFIRSKAALDGLLQQAQLGEDSATWSLDLLKRSKSINGETPPPEPAVAWLTLAMSALGKAQAEQEAIFEEPKRYWQAWLDQFDPENDPMKAALFHHAALFLHFLYQKQGQWQLCRNVNESTYKYYLSHEDWPRVIQSLKYLAHCCFELNEKENGDSYEKKLLNSLPFDKFPEDFKTQLTVDVITAKIARRDIAQAQVLLEQTRKITKAERFKSTLDRLQSEIDKKVDKV